MEEDTGPSKAITMAASVEEAGNGAGIDNGAGTDDRVVSDSKPALFQPTVAHARAMFGAALVILCFFKALLLCHGPMLGSVTLMCFLVRSSSLRWLAPWWCVVGSALCPLSCAELCTLYIGTGPIWGLVHDVGNAFAPLLRKDDENDKLKKEK